MNERFAFDDICICVIGYFVSVYSCIFVKDSYLYFICVRHNHHLFCSSTLKAIDLWPDQVPDWSTLTWPRSRLEYYDLVRFQVGLLWPGQSPGWSTPPPMTPIHRLLQSTLLSRHSPSYTLPSAILLFMPGQLNLNWTMLSSGCQKWKGSFPSQDLSCVFWMVPS